MANILIIDDDKLICDTLTSAIEGMGHKSTYALTLDDGLEAAFSGNFDIVFLDVWLPDGNGLHALPKIRETSSPEIIIITGEGDRNGAEVAIKNGAWDYVQKPLSINKITLPLIRALQYRRDNKLLKPPVALNRDGIVGNSPPMKKCLDLLAQASVSDANVLITGETGTGKECFAWAIHENSLCADKDFVVVDCTALPDTLVESLIFGHEKGAFTGADTARVGLVKQADGGTLFLDEVGELPLPLQKAFLRILEERRFRPLGGEREIESDFRLVSATNRDLDSMVQQGQFREDLLFRLRAFTIEVPPLRERIEDIRELTLYHLARLCKRHGIGTKGVSPDFFQSLLAYSWPGNVRELFHTLESAFAVARDAPTLFSRHLPTFLRIQLARDSVDSPEEGPPPDGEPKASTDTPDTLHTLRDFRETAEKQYLHDLLSHTEGNIRKACQTSGLSLSRFYALLKKHNISKKWSQSG